MEVAGNAGSALQDNVRQAERSASQLGNQRQQATAAVNTSRAVPGRIPASVIDAPEPAAGADSADARGPRFPSDPDRVTLSPAALQTERRERDEARGSIIDNDTGEVLPERPQPPQQNRNALDAYGAIQNIS